MVVTFAATIATPSSRPNRSRVAATNASADAWVSTSIDAAIAVKTARWEALETLAAEG